MAFTKEQVEYMKISDELDAFINRLLEWDNSRSVVYEEKEFLRQSIKNAKAASMNLTQARVALSDQINEQKKGLLYRIETGSTTVDDAKLAKELLG